VTHPVIPGASGPPERLDAFLAAIGEFPELCFFCARLAAFAMVENKPRRSAESCTCER
jgi:hypothetical protein